MSRFHFLCDRGQTAGIADKDAQVSAASQINHSVWPIREAQTAIRPNLNSAQLTKFDA